VTVVVDASALTIAVTDTTGRGDRVRTRLEGGAVAPHLVDAEVGQAIRGLVLRGVLNADDAEASLRAADGLVVERFPHPPLRGRAWQLRSNLSFYDGLYVALAEAVLLPLLTADVKLARTYGPRCAIEAV
jgi:predicted nucleic acid-binding protein